MCIDCLFSGKILKYQIPNNRSGKLKTLTEPGQKLQIDFTRKSQNQKLNEENQLLTAVDRFSKCPTVKVSNTFERKEVINFLTHNLNLYCTPIIHTCTGAVTRAIQNIKNLIVANSEDNICLTESVNRELKVMRFTKHTGVKFIRTASLQEAANRINQSG